LTPLADGATVTLIAASDSPQQPIREIKIMTNTNTKTFTIQTGTSHNGWVPVFGTVEVPTAAVCTYCEGFGCYDINIPECEACEGFGHNLSPAELEALPVTPCPPLA